jgi:anti-anti-sigma factor
MSAPALPSSVPGTPDEHGVGETTPSPFDQLLDCSLEIRSPGGGDVVIAIRGPLDVMSERMARATITAAAAAATGTVVVVLDDSFVDFRGLAVLLAVGRTCRRQSRMLRLVGVPPSLQTMCRALGVQNCWWEFDTTADALIRRAAEEAEQLKMDPGATERRITERRG